MSAAVTSMRMDVAKLNRYIVGNGDSTTIDKPTLIASSYTHLHTIRVACANIEARGYANDNSPMIVFVEADSLWVWKTVLDEYNMCYHVDVPVGIIRTMPAAGCDCIIYTTTYCASHHTWAQSVNSTTTELSAVAHSIVAALNADTIMVDIGSDPRLLPVILCYYMCTCPTINSIIMFDNSKGTDINTVAMAMFGSVEHTIVDLRPVKPTTIGGDIGANISFSVTPSNLGHGRVANLLDNTTTLRSVDANITSLTDNLINRFTTTDLLSVATPTFPNNIGSITTLISTLLTDYRSISPSTTRANLQFLFVATLVNRLRTEMRKVQAGPSRIIPAYTIIGNIVKSYTMGFHSTIDHMIANNEDTDHTQFLATSMRRIYDEFFEITDPLHDCISAPDGPRLLTANQVDLPNRFAAETTNHMYGPAMSGDVNRTLDMIIYALDHDPASGYNDDSKPCMELLKYHMAEQYGIDIPSQSDSEHEATDYLLGIDMDYVRYIVEPCDIASEGSVAETPRGYIQLLVRVASQMSKFVVGPTFLLISGISKSVIFTEGNKIVGAQLRKDACSTVVTETVDTTSNRPNEAVFMEHYEKSCVVCMDDVVDETGARLAGCRCMCGVCKNVLCQSCFDCIKLSSHARRIDGEGSDDDEYEMMTGLIATGVRYPDVNCPICRNEMSSHANTTTSMVVIDGTGGPLDVSGLVKTLLFYDGFERDYRRQILANYAPLLLGHTYVETLMAIYDKSRIYRDVSSRPVLPGLAREANVHGFSKNNVNLLIVGGSGPNKLPCTTVIDGIIRATNIMDDISGAKSYSTRYSQDPQDVAIIDSIKLIVGMDPFSHSTSDRPTHIFGTNKYHFILPDNLYTDHMLGGPSMRGDECACIRVHSTGYPLTSYDISSIGTTDADITTVVVELDKFNQGGYNDWVIDLIARESLATIIVMTNDIPPLDKSLTTPTPMCPEGYLVGRCPMRRRDGSIYNSLLSKSAHSVLAGTNVGVVRY